MVILLSSQYFVCIRAIGSCSVGEEGVLTLLSLPDRLGEIPNQCRNSEVGASGLCRYQHPMKD
jgi:hypothetical protein